MQKELLLNKQVLYHFNATCEMAVANGNNSYSPPEFLAKFERNLDFLPSYLSNAGDVVLVNEMPSQEFIDRIKPILKKVPHYLTKQQLLNSSLKDKLDAIEPWGWSPAEHKYLEAFKASCLPLIKSQPNFSWHKQHKELYSRRTALNVLKELLQASDNKKLYLDLNELPVICETIDDVLDKLNGWNEIIVKAPWSSSGRGLIVLNRGDVHATYKQWMNGIIKKQGFVMVEPYMKKLADLSIHFEIIANEKMNFLGQASFNTTEGGQYIGNNIQELPLTLNSREQGFCSKENLDHLVADLHHAIKASSLYMNYSGVLGVDVLLYYNMDGQLKFQPCLEINLRNNMGTLALAIRDKLHKKAKGTWQIKMFDSSNDVGLFDKEMTKKHPILLSDGKLLEGYLPLTEPKEGKVFLVYLLANSAV